MTIIAQVRYVFVFVTSVWLASFVSSRILLFSEEYARSVKDWDDDAFTLHTICGNHRVKANMGKNSHICEEAKVNVSIQPWQTAAMKVINATYLCGNAPCSDMMHQMTSSTHSLLLTIALTMVSPFLFMRIFERLFHKYEGYQDKKRLESLTDLGHNVLPTKEKKV